MAPRRSGATLAELLITLVVLALAAAAVLPNLSFNDSNKLAVAAEAVGNALRFARSEAMRTASNVLVDAETVPGRLLLSVRGCSAAGAAAVIDPQTKRAFDLAVSSDARAEGVVVTPKFIAGGSPWSGLVFDATGAAVQACSVVAQVARGTPQAGSGVDLSFGGKTRTIAIDPPTGRVTGF